MAGKFHHEAIYRGPAVLAKLAALRVAVCGVGAVGSNLAEGLVRQGVAHVRAIDKDRVEEHNVSTQAYGEVDVGAWKVEALRNRLFRVAGVEIEAVRKELTARNARLLVGGCDLVVDAFDNSASRRIVQDAVRAAGIACLHVGLNADYAESIWDERYRVPADAAGDVCDYPLARNLVMLAVAVASEAVVRFAADGRRENWSVTLGDFGVRAME